MVFFQLVRVGAEFAMAQLVLSRLGVTGLILLTLVLVGLRARSPRLAWWSAGLFFLLTLQLQS
ncbi:hypothetical protein [Streptomyces phaeochromogenes]|uniref:hypothetical protein n=1 Tax=Streptomyces phaeochromogenes TaxID=1923 RepID=UPI000AAD3013|nr:hypothetical protein [Streptomyces phaeochromogenes]